MSKANRYDEFEIVEREPGPPLVVDRDGKTRTTTRVERALWEILNRDDDKARIAILKDRIAELERADEASVKLSGEVIEDRNKRIAELEKALQEIVRTAATIPGDGCGGKMHPFAAQYLVSARAVDAASSLMESGR